MLLLGRCRLSSSEWNSMSSVYRWSTPAHSASAAVMVIVDGVVAPKRVDQRVSERLAPTLQNFGDHPSSACTVTPVAQQNHPGEKLRSRSCGFVS
jgi:hypothetical protein